MQGTNCIDTFINEVNRSVVNKKVTLIQEHIMSDKRGRETEG